MIEIMIERWNNLDGTTEYQWSVWREGSRVEMGGPYATGDAAEAAAYEYCDLKFGAEQATVTRL
jgi:hypothetical protein